MRSVQSLVQAGKSFYFLCPKLAVEVAVEVKVDFLECYNYTKQHQTDVFRVVLCTQKPPPNTQHGPARLPLLRQAMLFAAAAQHIVQLEAARVGVPEGQLEKGSTFNGVLLGFSRGFTGVL